MIYGKEWELSPTEELHDKFLTAQSLGFCGWEVSGATEFLQGEVCDCADCQAREQLRTLVEQINSGEVVL